VTVELAIEASRLTSTEESGLVWFPCLRRNFRA
jgi:hypothetical protein